MSLVLILFPGEKKFTWEWAEQYGLTPAGLDEAKAKALCDWKLATLLLTESRFVGKLMAAGILEPAATEAWDKIPKAKGTLIRASTDLVTYVVMQPTLVPALRAMVRHPDL